MSGKHRIFKTDFGGSSPVTDPETLFHNLRGRAPEIKHLWSHQADLLRDYAARCRNSGDVAIELPTGAGKTLVGLLIAEFRRQNMGDRVAYLCPTRQLARQVGDRAVKYGIKAHTLIGKQRDYPADAFSEFQTGKAVAITTYSAVFNTNPRIDDAQVLILDDAHASENYIASMWSLELQRTANEDLYRAVVGLLQEGLPEAFFANISGSSEVGARHTSIVELVPGRFIRMIAPAIREMLDAGVENDTAQYYAWTILKEHLPACGVFVSLNSILIRPFIPPTFTHAPFTRPAQRIYMSATLGAGGELERITGIRAIQRLPIPSGWDKRGSGRRLFLVPQVSMPDDRAHGVVLNAARTFGRSLILAPTHQEAEKFRGILSSIDLLILGAQDIEDSIEPFVDSKNAALVLSRYDGLDFPDDACRLLVIAGLPCGTNLQEKFLWSRIAAHALLRDRVLTRFTQGVGRCTRSDNDFAVIFVLGRSLVDFILKIDNRQVLHPELQAELQFGIENCRDKSEDEFQELQEAFVAQGAEWEEAESSIISLRDRSARRADPMSQKLSATVADEVSYLYAMWNGDFESALKDARNVADALAGDETKGYRGWWYYLSADAAQALGEVTGDTALEVVVKDCLARAGKCCPAISWFARLARLASGNAIIANIDASTSVAVENIRDTLTEWGMFGGRFEREVTQAIKDLRATEYKQFHRGLKLLGEMLGFRAKIFDGEGDPDCLWSINEVLHIVHEAKSDHTPDDPIGINDIRQSQSHEDWVRNHCACSNDVVILPLIASPRTRVSPKALTYAKSVCHVQPEQLKILCEKCADVLRIIRVKSADLSDEKFLEELYRALTSAELTPSAIVKQFSAALVSRMPTSP